MTDRLTSPDTGTTDNTRYLRALVAWRTGDKSAFDLVMNEVITDDNPTASVNLLIAGLRQTSQWLDEMAQASEDQVNDQLRAGIALMTLHGEDQEPTE